MNLLYGCVYATKRVFVCREEEGRTKIVCVRLFVHSVEKSLFIVHLMCSIFNYNLLEKEKTIINFGG